MLQFMGSQRAGHDLATDVPVCDYLNVTRFSILQLIFKKYTVSTWYRESVNLDPTKTASNSRFYPLFLLTRILCQLKRLCIKGEIVLHLISSS